MTVQSLFARFVVAFALGAALVLAAGTLAAEESRLSGTMPTADTRREVWQAVVGELRKQGLSDLELPGIGDLDLPVLAIASLEGQSLRVTSACWDSGPRRTQFRVECGASGQCLPFLVYFRDAANSDAAPAAHTTPCRVASRHPATGGMLEPTVRAGGRATAVFHGDGLRMTAVVTCLERGREGEVIRVRAVDGRVFRARISGPGQLEALPQ